MNDDKVLVEKTLAGDKKAFEMIVQKYQAPLLNYIGRMVGEREMALDFTQDVFIKVYSSLHTYSPLYKFSTWLYRIASNTLIDFWRKKKIDALSIDQSSFDSDKRRIQVPDNELSIVSKFELSQIREQIEKALKKLPPGLRELFIWRHINQFSYDEMAEIKGIPVGTIKNRVFQAKEIIRKHMEKKQ
jgi:RNA polymerase sigma-70 factor (ECF subfamily)